MNTPRPATADDVDMLARIHVQAWRETYTGLLPDAEIRARTLESRRRIWSAAIAWDAARMWLIDGTGFAQIAPQREEIWRKKGYPEELFAIYLLRKGYGQGRALLQAAFGSHGQPFTACVLEENIRACAFYEKSGGQCLVKRTETIGQTSVQERVYGWTVAPFSASG